jgi:hypothetical protein
MNDVRHGDQEGLQFVVKVRVNAHHLVQSTSFVVATPADGYSLDSGFEARGQRVYTFCTRVRPQSTVGLELELDSNLNLERLVSTSWSPGLLYV